MRTIIVEDEIFARKHLRHLVQQNFGWLTLVGEAASVHEAYHLIMEETPDLLLLDIRLGDQTAFDLLDVLEEFSCLVIFITGYNEYAVKAFEVAAVDYLLKPVTVEHLQKALERARLQFEFQHSKPLLSGLASLLKEVQKNNTFIVLADRNDRIRVPVANIEYCASINGCVEVNFTDGRKLLVSRDFAELCRILQPHDFIRCHQSYLVNEHCIALFSRGEGKAFLTMKNGGKVPLARNNVNEVRNRLKL